MRKTGFAVVAALSLASLSAMAAETSDKTYAYFGASAGSATSNVWDKGAGPIGYTTVTEKTSSTNGYKVHGGFAANGFGFEIGYYDFGTYDISGRVGASSAADSVSATAVAISLTGNWSATDSLKLGGKIGFAGVTGDYRCVRLCTGISNRSTSSTVPVFGVGASWAFTKNIAARIDWETFIGAEALGTGNNAPKSDFSLLSAGLEFRF